MGYAEYINKGNFAFPVSAASLDDRLLPGDRVLAIKVGDRVRGYPLDTMEEIVLRDQIGAQDIVIFASADGAHASVYDPRLNGDTLTFENRNGEIVDLQTDSTWDLSGVAIQGPLHGERLTPLPSRTSYWFAIVAAEPQISLYP